MALIDKYFGDLEPKWIPFPDEPGTAFLLAHSDAKEPRKAIANAMSKLRRRALGGEPDPEKVLRATVDWFVNYIVKDWRGWEQKDDAGKLVPVPFTKDNLRSFLMQSPRVRDWIATQAQDIDNFNGSMEEGESEASGGTERLKSDAPVASGVG